MRRKMYSVRLCLRRNVTAIALIVNVVIMLYFMGIVAIGRRVVPGSGHGLDSPHTDNSIQVGNGLSDYQWKLLGCMGLVRGKVSNVTALHERLSMPQLAFLPNYKNPCIANGTSGRIQCLPYFYVPGQAKCGTSDLYQALKKHPNVSMKTKEFGWWNGKRVGDEDIEKGRWQSLQEYMSRFQNTAKNIQNTETGGYHPLITGDMSATYFSWEERWPLYPGNEGLREPKYTLPHFIRTLTPDARIIISFRNPIDRLYSHYFDHASTHSHMVATPQGFHEAVVRDLRLVNDCLRQRNVRECAYDVCLNHESTVQVRLRESMYSIFVADWLSAFPRHQILFIKFEGYSAYRASVLPTIFKFLGTGPMPAAILNSLSSSAPVNRRHVQHRSVGPMLNETRQLLAEFFEPFNRQLVNILKDKRFLYGR